MKPVNPPKTIRDMIASGALFVVNHSAGKDSQAMTAHLVNIGIPTSQMLVIHADLGEVEWEGNMDHIRATIPEGVPVIVAKATKTFFDMVEHRGMFPSPSHRQCTSDLKRAPIEREVRRYLKTHPEFGGQVVNCMGMRGEESPARAKKSALTRSAKNSKAGREWWDWLPIHDLTADDVFSMIAAAGQEPHWAYAAGMSRLSCCFCIMASKSDLTTAAQLRPDLYRRYVETEKRLDHTLSMSRKPLEEITGVPAT